MFCFGILRIFGGNCKKKENWKIWALSSLRRGVDLRQGVGYPRLGEAEVPKWHPSSTSRRSISALRRGYCSQQAIFGFLFSNTSYSYTDSLRTLINY